MMSLLSLISIFGILLFFVLACAAFFRAVEYNEHGSWFGVVIGLLLSMSLWWTQCHDSTYKSTMLAISKDNISKDKGVFTVKFFKGQEREHKTSEYNEIKYIEYLDSNEFQKACIKFTEGYDIYGIENCGGSAKIVPCDSTLAQ